MPPKNFPDKKALQDYVELHGLEYIWEGTRAFVKRQRLLSPEQYDAVAVRTSRKVSRAMLFSQSILRAELETKLRRAMAVKLEQEAIERAKQNTASG